MKMIAAALLLFALTTVSPAQQAAPKTAEIPKGKQTVLGLYLTSEQAYEKYKADPENIGLIDVRTPEEYMFVGHAADTPNIPLMLQTYQWNPEGTRLALRPNPDFMAEVKKRFQTGDTILVMCRSGARSSKAVNLMAEAGFKNAYQILDGFEGDGDKSASARTKGERTINGWRNAGLPWTYEIRREWMCLPEKK